MQTFSADKRKAAQNTVHAAMPTPPQDAWPLLRERLCIISATRNNHGQSIAFAVRRHGLWATSGTPHGNSIGKNAAMRALGNEGKG